MLITVVQDLKGGVLVEIDMVATGLDLKILDQEKVMIVLLVEIGGVMVQVIMKIEVIVTEKMMRAPIKVIIEEPEIIIIPTATICMMTLK